MAMKLSRYANLAVTRDDDALRITVSLNPDKVQTAVSKSGKSDIYCTTAGIRMFQEFGIGLSLTVFQTREESEKSDG